MEGDLETTRLSELSFLPLDGEVHGENEHGQRNERHREIGMEEGSFTFPFKSASSTRDISISNFIKCF